MLLLLFLTLDYFLLKVWFGSDMNIEIGNKRTCNQERIIKNSLLKLIQFCHQLSISVTISPFLDILQYKHTLFLDTPPLPKYIDSSGFLDESGHKTLHIIILF